MKRLNLTIWIFVFLFSAPFLIAQTNYITPIQQPGSLEAPSICIVSVTPDNKNIVVWEKPTDVNIDSFRIYRESTLQTGDWDLIGLKEYSGVSEFIDLTAQPSKQSYRYKLSAVDACGFQTVLSSEHKTINLSVVNGLNNSWSLIWDQYVGFTVSSYRIYRGTALDNMMFIGSTTAGNFNYNDLDAPAGDIYYQIEVICPVLCNPTTKKSTIDYGSSRSNIVSNNTINGIDGLKQDAGLVIYPNPCKSKTIVSFPNADHKIYEISVFNFEGKLMVSKSTKSDQVPITLENFKDGIYLIEIKGSKIYRGKVVINQQY